MPERIAKEFRLAKSAARIGATALFVILGLEVIVLGAFSLVVPATVGVDEGQMAGWAISVIGSLSTCAVTLLLALFLSKFSGGNSPFGRVQFRRLILAGVILVIRATLDSFTELFAPTTYEFTSSSAITFMPTAALDLKVVVMVVFLVCLAMVVRYGDALKEDSDAFV